ncbi:hypothetical protein KJ553_03345, partial [Patescibacteria group bacterium]|nr:hypothetical protein [Patescibacteria group bacterium]
FILIIYFGLIFSSLIKEGLPFLEKLGLSYILGLGLTTLMMFFYSWIGVKITLGSIVILLLTLIVLVRYICHFLKRKIEIKIPNMLKEFKFLKRYEKIICVGICLIFFISLLINAYYPVYVWDALALYDFRAKIIAQTGYFVQVAKQFDYFAHYPLLTSLTHTIVYVAGGSNPKFTYFLFYLSFGLIFYGVLRRHTNISVAIFFTFVLVSTPTLFEQSVIAYTNLPYTVFYVTGTLYLYLAVINKSNNYLLLSSLLIGLSTWTRATEPFWLTGIVVVLLYSIYKKSIFPILTYLPGFLIIQQPWKVHLSRFFGDTMSTSGQISSASKILLSGASLNRVIEVVGYIYQNIILTWGPMFFFFLIAAFIDIKNRHKKGHLVLLLIIIVNLLLLFVGTYAFSITNVEWKKIPGSARRMSIFFLPLMIYYIGLVLGNTIFKREQTEFY